MNAFLVLLSLAATARHDVSLSPARTDSIAKDSIYSLAVDPTAHPNDAVVWLLDEGVYRIEADGRASRTIRQVVQILKPAGAFPYREQQFSYDPLHQRLTINRMRVVRPNGEIVSAQPSQVQESDVPAAMSTPTYTGLKVKRMSLSGLDSGTILDYSVTTEDFKPFMDGDFFVTWRVTPSVLVLRSNLVVDVPEGMNPRIAENALNFQRKEQKAGGRKTYTWATSNVPRVRGEPFTPDSISPAMTVTVSPPFDWRAIGKWYIGIARNGYAITPLVRDKIASVVSSARTRDDSIKAIHRWVAQDIRYVAIELGRGGYVPRSADTVVRTGFGDCKDKTMLFLAALRQIGVTGYPVLLNAFGVGQIKSPALEQFNHMIAAVQRGNSYEFADMTAGSYPLGLLPHSEQGKLGVLVREGDAEELRLPAPATGESQADYSIAGELSEEGIFNGTYLEMHKGSDAAFLRQIFSNAPDSMMRASLPRAIAGSYFEGADGDSLRAFDGKDFSAPVRISLRITNGKPVTHAANLLLFTNPIRPMTSLARLAAELERGPKRTMPIDVAKLAPPTVTHIEVKIKLPAGWTATLPKNEKISGPLGNYETVYSQTGRDLFLSRTISGSTGILPPERINEVLAWFKAVGSDDSKLIVLQKQ